MNDSFDMRPQLYRDNKLKKILFDELGKQVPKHKGARSINNWIYYDTCTGKYRDKYYYIPVKMFADHKDASVKIDGNSLPE